MNQIQEAKRDQIADFLRRRVLFALQPPSGDFSWMPPFGEPRTLPATEVFAQQLLADAEFRSLQLGTWLNTTEGEVITQAVSLVIPPIYKPEFDLAVEGLQTAANMQRQQGQQMAGQYALGIVSVCLILIGLASLGRQLA
jgi:hypothetical protein